MVCIYCEKSTKVGNSRPTNQNYEVWRRRICTVCKASFTTIESPQLTGSIMVRKRDDRLEPFFESKLLVSLLRAANNQLRHDDVHELLRTIKKNIVRTGQSGQVKSTTISEAVAETLARYDPKMLARYQAYAK